MEDAELPLVVRVFGADSAPCVGEIAVVVTHPVRHHPVPGVEEQQVAVQPPPLVEVAPVVQSHCCVEPQTVQGVLAVQRAVALRRGDVDWGTAGVADVGTRGQQGRGLDPVWSIESQPGVETVHTVGGGLVSQAGGRVANVELGVDPLLLLSGVEYKVVSTILPSNININQTKLRDYDTTIT